MSAGVDFKFDEKNFEKHVHIILNLIQSELRAKNITILAFIVGNNEVLTYNKSSALQEWLFGLDLEDTFVVLSSSKIVIVTGKKKAQFLEDVKKCDVTVEINVRSRDDNFNVKFQEILESLGFDFSNDHLGIFEKDKFQGYFSESWYKFLEKSTFKKSDVSINISSILSIKDNDELNLTRHASMVNSSLYTSYIKSKLLDIIDDEKTVKHSKISDDIENELEFDKYLSPGMSVSDVESCFPPIIQSGGNYNLKFSSNSDNKPLEYDCVISMVGVRFKYYCSSIVRTLMVSPCQELKDAYSFILSVHENLLSALKPGAKFSDIYNYIYNHVNNSYPTYSENFVKNLGFITGLEFRESNYILDGKSTATVKPGMVFCTLVGFQNIKIKNLTKLACVAVGDTVYVSENGGQYLTTCKRSLGSCSVMLSNEANESDVIIDEKIRKGPAILPSRKRQPQLELPNNEEQRKAHQAELKVKLNEEARKRLVSKDTLGTKKGIDEAKHFVKCYTSTSDLPNENDLQNLKVFVDKKAESVLIPIFGMNVPFHISTIKNVSSNIEGNFTYLRINFNTLTGPSSKTEDLSITYGRNVHIKEMILRNCNSRPAYDSTYRSNSLSLIFNQIKDLQKNFKARIMQEAEMEGVVKQADLQINPSKAVYRLKDVLIRPQIGLKRSNGMLEAHLNGFRFSSTRGEKVDILYRNIRHAFFQPCDHEAVIVIHFHLKHPIMIGKKKYCDVQFYTEIGEVVSDLGKINNQRGMLDRDEIEAEDDEREMRNRLKLAYKSFIDKVESMKDCRIDFEVPLRELGFFGVPHKTLIFLLPTTHCLINIIDVPPFIVSLNEVELVHFERVGFQMKNFDMVIIFKDYNKRVCNIASIPMNYLESIKDWLNSCDIKYTESTQNLNWPKIMKTILDDPDEFFSTGGWTFLDPESEDEGAAAEVANDEEDDEYQPESSEEHVEESEIDSDYQSENSDESGIETEASDSGKSWSELEEEARAMDAMKYGVDQIPRSKKRTASHHQSLASKKRRT